MMRERIRLDGYRSPYRDIEFPCDPDLQSEPRLAPKKEDEGEIPKQEDGETKDKSGFIRIRVHVHSEDYDSVTARPLPGGFWIEKLLPRA